MWLSRKSAAPPPPIATQQHGRPSSSFSVLQPTPVNANGPGAGASSKTQEPRIGRLPVSVHARILSYLPVPEVPRYALGCRALAQLVRTDEGTWKTRCFVLGVEPAASAEIGQSHERNAMSSPILPDQNGRAGQHRRRQSSSSGLKEMTNPSDAARRPPGAFVFEETEDVRDNDDEFGDFSESFSASSSTATPKASGKIATLGKPPTGKKPNGTPNLMDLDGFEDFDFNAVPLPSNAQSPAKTKDRPRSGFFALPAAAPEHPRASTIQRSTGKPAGHWYETYKRVHRELMPYVKILRISSSSPNNPGTTSSSHLTPTQTLALLFPSSHSHDSPVPGSLPLVAQATVLSRLVLFLTPIIEPSADWAWTRRVLIGGGGVIDRWDGGCLSGFENLERRSQASQPEGAVKRADNDDKLVEEMRGVAGASWSVHTALARSKVLSAPSSNRTRNKSNGKANSTGVSFTTRLGAWGGLGGAEADETGWELGRVWVEKREVFYESGSGGKWDSGENIVKLPSVKGQPATHTLDFTPMSAVFMERMLARIREDCGEALRIFGTGSRAGRAADGGAGASVVKRFVDRLVGEVISEYVSSLLSLTRLLSQDLFLTATAATFVQVWRVVDCTKEVIREALAAGSPAEAVVDIWAADAINAVGSDAEKAVYAAFEPHMDEYLDDETEWIKNVLDKMCKAWDAKTGNAGTTPPTQTATFLSSSNPGQVKKNVLAGFRDALLLPVTIVPLTVTYGMNAIVTGGTQAVNGLAMLNPQRWTGQGGSEGRETSTGSPAVVVNPEAADQVPEEITTAVDQQNMEIPAAAPDQEGERMQLLLSLDTVLEFVHADRECLKRIETFAGYPSKYGKKVREAIEEVFIHLLRAVAGRHIVPACNKAIQQMTTYKPEDSAEGTSNPPLLQYLELVNVVDTVTSILQVYFDKDLAKYIDRTDFLNAAMQEKKRFEGSLDDAVAAGMNAGVEVLMNQVEHIIQTRTQPGEYCPSPDQNPELGPTKACTDAIECLEVHCKLLKGSTSKEVLEVFYQEVGLRLQNILQRHIKRQIISLDGGFQMIADLNAYYAFVASLKQPRMAEEFSNLKMLGQVYIVADAKDLTQIIRDVTRYGGTYRPEDLYEFIQRRADWKKIEKTVDNSMYALSVKEDCIIM